MNSHVRIQLRRCKHSLKFFNNGKHDLPRSCCLHYLLARQRLWAQTRFYNHPKISKTFPSLSVRKCCFGLLKSRHFRWTRLHRYSTIKGGGEKLFFEIIWHSKEVTSLGTGTVLLKTLRYFSDDPYRGRRNTSPALKKENILEEAFCPENAS